MTDPSSMRRSYSRGLFEDDAAQLPGWLDLFRIWFGEAAADDAVTEPNAMQVATVSVAGAPSVRTVLLKALDERGIVFYTNYDSAKGRDLAANPRAAAVFAWLAHERQVRFAGPVERVARAETEAYFASRPRGSQIGAWASPQSAVVASRSELETLQAQVEQRFGAGPVPAPPHWGGYRITPVEVEFWQGRRDRLHDRMRYRRVDEGWTRERLAP